MAVVVGAAGALTIGLHHGTGPMAGNGDRRALRQGHRLRNQRQRRPTEYASCNKVTGSMFAPTNRVTGSQFKEVQWPPNRVTGSKFEEAQGVKRELSAFGTPT